MVVGVQTSDGDYVCGIAPVCQHIAATGGDGDAVICGIGGSDVEGAAEIGAGEIAHQIGHHLPSSTEEAEQGVLG